MAASPVLPKPHPAAERTAKEIRGEDYATSRVPIVEPRAVLDHSLKENLGHHPFVFVIEKMAVKDGHAPDYRVSEVHNDVDGTTIWNVHGV